MAAEGFWSDCMSYDFSGNPKHTDEQNSDSLLSGDRYWLPEVSILMRGFLEGD
jgi:hypothetical protein